MGTILTGTYRLGERPLHEEIYDGSVKQDFQLEVSNNRIVRINHNVSAEVLRCLQMAVHEIDKCRDPAGLFVNGARVYISNY